MEIKLIYFVLVIAISIENRKLDDNVCKCPQESGTFCGHFLLKNVSRSTFCEQNRIYNCVYQSDEDEATTVKDCKTGEYCLDNIVEEEEGKWLYGATCEPEGEEVDAKYEKKETTTTTTVAYYESYRKHKKTHRKHENSLVEVNDVKLFNSNDQNVTDSSIKNTETTNQDNILKLEYFQNYSNQSSDTNSLNGNNEQTDNDNRLRESDENSDQINNYESRDSDPYNQKPHNDENRPEGENKEETREQSFESTREQSFESRDSEQNQKPILTDDSQSSNERTNYNEEGNKNAQQSDRQTENNYDRNNQYFITTTEPYDNSNSNDQLRDDRPSFIII